MYFTTVGYIVGDGAFEREQTCLFGFNCSVPNNLVYLVVFFCVFYFGKHIVLFVPFLKEYIVLLFNIVFHRTIFCC